MFKRNGFSCVALLALACSSLHATSVGELHRTTTTPTAAIRDAEHRDQLRVTVWYPAVDGAVESPLDIGAPGHPSFRSGSAAVDAAIADGKHPVVLLSHGFGGSARMMGWFGTAMARAGYVVVAVDHPGNNGRDPMTMAGGTLIWERPEDLRAAINAVQKDPLIAPHLDMHRLGVAGFSAGGFTALVSAGARFNLDRFKTFCHTHASDPTCLPQKEAPDVTFAAREQALNSAPLAALTAHAGDDHSITGVKAVFVMAPGPIQGLEPDTLKALKTPVAIILGNADKVALPGTNGDTAARLLPHATLKTLPDVGHYDFLGNCTETGLKEEPLCALKLPQDGTHDAAIAMAKALFAKNL
ncbi:alpha/beta hydrolase family protein [Dyella tabacisoli]|uniref:PET hydrolase/cutinase-like domain-containing protein n=1 Tax=Dyella tabacisoli TaxID=2282381 RepID=A0A369UT31_9GAMM|nr:alpha/beta hydrolase [Dyella tabacisoli]RDD83473.1 hypothetical protein DVJ77_02530 [Dyella tabacisoli]